MSRATFVSASHEKGWGTLFDVRVGDKELRFSIAADTLRAIGLRCRTKKTFPEVFDANIQTLLHIAQMLVDSGRINPQLDFEGTEILPEHVAEVIRA